MPTARAWREYPRRYRYEAAVCTKCGKWHFPARLICDECGGRLIQREDDKGEIIQRRFEVYEMQTFPIIERYSTVGKLREISGELEIEKIPEVLKKLLKSS